MALFGSSGRLGHGVVEGGRTGALEAGDAVDVAASAVVRHGAARVCVCVRVVVVVVCVEAAVVVVWCVRAWTRARMRWMRARDLARRNNRGP